MSSDFIKQLKSQINIAEVVGEFVRLKKSGSNFMGLCPFHAERSPSFSVSERKGIYHCFGCQKTGDIISFVQEAQSVSFAEAVKILCSKFGIKAPAEFLSKTSSIAVAREAPQSEILFKLNRFVAQFYHERLFSPEGENAREYLKSRGINENTIKSAYIGFAPDSWAELYDFLNSKKAPMEKAEELGLIRRKTGGADQWGRAHYDLFRNRVLFPIIDFKGRVVAFGGRTLSEEEKSKYLNSTDSLIFKKSEQLYGIFTAQKDIRAEDSCIVVEGFMDCLALQQAGICNVVATLGTALTERHVSTLRKLTTNIIILFDGDSAGIEAENKAMNLFLKEGLVVKGVQLPEGLDPDEYIGKYGVEKLRTLLQNAPFLLDRKIMELAVQAGSHSEARSRAVDQILPWIAQIPSDTARMVRIQDLSGLFHLPSARLEQQVHHLTKANSPRQTNQSSQNMYQRQPPSRGTSVRMPKKDVVDPLDLKLVSVLVRCPELLIQIDDFEAVKKGINHIEVIEFIDFLFKDYHDQIISNRREYECDSAILDQAKSDFIKAEVASALIEAERDLLKKMSLKPDEQKESLENSILEIQDLETKLTRRGLEKRRDQLRKILLQADQQGDPDNLRKWMSEYNELVRTLHEVKAKKGKIQNSDFLA